MGANLNSRLRKRSSSMQDYDRLPPELRAWLAQAALPWSVASVRKVWARTRRDPQAALARLRDLEARNLHRDAPQIWGPAHPVAQTRP